MAGDWMKVELALPDKPEVWAIADATGIDPDAVVGKLLRVWGWFDTHTENGNAKGVTCAFLDRLTFVTGFANSMLDVGWLDVFDGGLMLPNFDKHNGQTAKKRAETARRVAKHREKVSNENSVTKTLPEKRREDINNKNTTSTAARFDEWWKAYPKKIEKKKAREIWKRRKLDALADTIIADTIARPTKCAKWAEGYIPNPTTYLNGDRWEDEYQKPSDRQNGKPSLPKDDTACVQFLAENGIQPRPGESMWDFRRRGEVAIHGT